MFSYKGEYIEDDGISGREISFSHFGKDKFPVFCSQSTQRIAKRRKLTQSFERDSQSETETETSGQRM
jgi:hypothetical protein